MLFRSNEPLLAAVGGNQSVDALAVAPYFGVPQNISETVVQSWNLDNVFTAVCGTSSCAQARPGSSLNSTFNSLNANRRIAQRYGVDLIGYEGGQHLISTSANPTVNNLYISANGDQRMGEAYRNYWDLWSASDGEILMHLGYISSWGQFGSFGLLRHYNEFQVGNGKWNATMNFITNNNCWWQECARPSN